MGTARHEDAVGGSAFEGKFRERESPGLSRGFPSPHVHWHTEGPVLEPGLLLLRFRMGGRVIRWSPRLATRLSAVQPPTSGLRTGPAGGTIPWVANACQKAPA